MPSLTVQRVPLLLHNLRFRSAGYLQVLSDVWFLPALYYSSSQELYREPPPVATNITLLTTNIMVNTIAEAMMSPRNNIAV